MAPEPAFTNMLTAVCSTKICAPLCVASSTLRPISEAMSTAARPFASTRAVVKSSGVSSVPAARSRAATAVWTNCSTR